MPAPADVTYLRARSSDPERALRVMTAPSDEAAALMANNGIVPGSLVAPPAEPATATAAPRAEPTATTAPQPATATTAPEPATTTTAPQPATATAPAVTP